MLHAKTFVVDGEWSTIGSMNFDNRSMALNEEATLMVDNCCRSPIHLQVSDLRQSLSYYEQVLGLSPRNVTSESAALSVDADDKPLVMR
jgi:cardiolipin synthase